MNQPDITASPKHTNRLIHESSPYLLAHAHNPVDWRPWSDEALEESKKTDKPIFLSIGYAACHWCHVMEKESFENEEIASILNKHYIPIKVDREQRPDIDQIYMQATMAMTGSGGWPMSVFLTPDLKPFFAGTYFPPENRHGLPGFKYLITELADGFKTERARIEEIAQKIADSLKQIHYFSTEKLDLDISGVEQTYRALMNSFDSISGGFGSAPKFPHPIELSFLLQWYATSDDKQALYAVEKTLQAMARGGIYDQIGGGFHRYSTDGRWLVPHFEKMLYDNALLVMTYCDAFRTTHNDEYLRTVKETLDFILREMTDPDGGFYSSLDADSDGEEGKYYIWKKTEIENLLDEKSEIFCKYYNISEYGNFDSNTNIPNIDGASEEHRKLSGITSGEFNSLISKSKQTLLATRERRTPPGKDDKILTSWNALAISAFCRGYQITRDEKYRSAALSAAEFIVHNLLDDAQLKHSCRKGTKSSGLFLEDYAYFSAALIDLYETSHKIKWLDLALRLTSESTSLFSDNEGNLFLAPDKQKDHYIRPRDIADGALPAPGSILIQTYLRLGWITGDNQYQAQARIFLAALSGAIAQVPQAMTSAAAALHSLFFDNLRFVIVGKKNRDPLLDEINQYYFPSKTLLVSDRGDESFISIPRPETDENAAVYICQNYTCGLPISVVSELHSRLEQLRSSLK